jgi:hypothetical protein
MILAGGIPIVLALVKSVGCSEATVFEVDWREPSEKVDERADMVDIEITGKVLTLSERLIMLPSVIEGDFELTFRDSISKFTPGFPFVCSCCCVSSTCASKSP